jgi:hypothetical protein
MRSTSSRRRAHIEKLASALAVREAISCLWSSWVAGETGVPKFVSGGTGAAVSAARGINSSRASRWAIGVLGGLALGLGACVAAQAAEAYSADAVKAEFLYRFAGYVEWPEDLPPDAPFTIAVAASDGVFNELQHLLPGRTIQNRRVELRKVSGAADLEHTQILYVPSHAGPGARELLAAAVRSPILIVTDEAGGLKNGSVVNFLQVDRHVRFEISLTAAERSRLKINSGLLSVAAYVEGVRPRADISCWQTFAFGFKPACLLRQALARIDARARARRAETRSAGRDS